LSEVWACGLPGIVPDEGALGERVARHGGGWRLPAGFSGTDAAALLIRLFSAEGASERARVISSLIASDTQRIPTLEAMSRDVDALYARFAQPPADASDADAAREALAPLLAVNLDGFAFRRELINLAGEIVATKNRLDEVQQRNAKLDRAVADAASWATKLQRDVDTATASAAELEKNSAAWVAKVEHDSKAWAAKLETDIAALKREIERLANENRRLAEPKAAFELLPEIVRKYLLQRASRARR
jgi:chromosome segregation ATPase